MSADIEFVDGPPPKNMSRPGSPGNKGKGKWFDRCALMRENPGQWMRFASSETSRSGVVLGLKGGKKSLGGAQPREFEATSRQEGAEFFVYARYVGHLAAVADEVAS